MFEFEIIIIIPIIAMAIFGWDRYTGKLGGPLRRNEAELQETLNILGQSFSASDRKWSRYKWMA
jgi:hypothetical protein